MDALISGLLKTGAPWGLLCAVLLAAVWCLWKRSNQQADKLYEIAVDQVRVNSEINHTLGHMEKNVDEITRKIRID